MNLKTRIFKIVLFTAVLSAQQLFAQAPEPPKVIPPSPETATILQHSPVNVSLYTGTPNISVPFHTISHGGVQVPISLSYSSDGIRVENIASWAGLGWSLNAGGLISRTVNKLPDDAPIGYMNTQYTISELLARNDDPMSSYSKQGQLWTILGFGTIRDYEPDVFNFSFPGYSGQFHYKRVGNGVDIELIQTPLSNLKIETTRSSGVITGFAITDEAGIKYYFGESRDASRKGRELLRDAVTKSQIGSRIYTSNPPYSIGSFNCYQSWMLMDIVFPTSSEIIKFSYLTEDNVETFVMTGQATKKGYTIGCEETSTSFMVKKFDQPKVDKIEFPLGKVIFEKETTQRLDLGRSYALKRILLKNSNDTIVKKMQLHTSYMVSPTETITQFYADVERGKHRLRLDSLSLQGRGTSTATQGSYVFKYNPIKLPNRYSNSIDYFGYYNGRQNISLLPKTFFKALYFINPNAMHITVGNANRSVYPNYTNASVLEKIIYPTGGYDEFVWENNFVGNLSGDETSYRDYLIDNFVHNNPNNNNSSYIPDTTDGSFYFMTDTNFPGVTLQGNTYRRNMTVPTNLSGGIEFTATMSGCNSPSFNQNTCHFLELKIIGITNPGFSLNILEQQFTKKVADLPAGDYQVVAVSKATVINPNQQVGSAQNPTATLNIKWSRDPNPDESIYAGLRIKAVNTFDRQGSKAFSKEYEYTYLDTISNTYKCSGNAMNFIDVLDENYFTACTVTGDPQVPGMSNYLIGMGYKLTSGSQVPMEASKGSLVAYSHVTEKFNGGLNGYNKYTYSFTDKFPLDPPTDPSFTGLVSVGSYSESFKHRVYCDWRRGNLEKMESYDKNHNKLTSKSYQYEAANTSFIVNFGIESMAYDPYPAGYTEVCPCDKINVNFYPAVTEYHRLTQTRETNYLGGQEMPLVKDYDYNAFNQVLRETVIEEEGQKVSSTRYSYANDPFIQGMPFVAELRNQNRIGMPLVVEKYYGTNRENLDTLSREETVYKDWDPGAGLHLSPEVIKTSKGGAETEPRVKYNAVDITTGNPLEVEQAGGTKISYIWGYNKTQPIAKIENATNAEIKTALGVTDLTLVNEANLTDINNLRALLPNAMVTTYTYKPLVGISTVTDPKGDKVTYHYDSFGRLESVRDRDGNILSENQYRYRTQN